jgi:protein-S-isoprenylcysteine O-methyltransferase Ste14
MLRDRIMASSEKSNFAIRNLRLLRFLIFGLAIGAYAFDRDDIVWATLPWHMPHDRVVAHLIFLVGAFLVGLAAALRTWVRAYTGSTLDFEYVRRDQSWFADGPFRYIRHPIVVGELLFVLGMGLLLSRTGLAIALAGIGVLGTRLVATAERVYQRQNGANYPSLCETVPSLLPSFRSRVGRSDRLARWGRAFRIEAADWGYFLMFILFSITLKDRLAWISAAAAFLISLILNPPFRRPTEVRTSGTRQFVSLIVVCVLSNYSQAYSQSRPGDRRAGSGVFAIRCSACHSTRKDSKIGPGLEGVLRGKHLSERDVRRIVSKGKRTMPPLGARITGHDLDDLMAYLKTL